MEAALNPGDGIESQMHLPQLSRRPFLDKDKNALDFFMQRIEFAPLFLVNVGKDVHQEVLHLVVVLGVWCEGGDNDAGAIHRESSPGGGPSVAPRYACPMKNPFLITGVLSIALWVTIREQAFAADPLLASVATVLLLGYGLFGVFWSLRSKDSKD